MTAVKRFLLHDSHVEFLNVDLGRFGPVRVTCKRCGRTQTTDTAPVNESPLSVALALLDDQPCALAVVGSDGLPQPAV